MSLQLFSNCEGVLVFCSLCKFVRLLSGISGDCTISVACYSDELVELYLSSSSHSVSFSFLSQFVSIVASMTMNDFDSCHGIRACAITIEAFLEFKPIVQVSCFTLILNVVSISVLDKCFDLCS